MNTHEKLLPCPFCEGVAEILPGAPGLYSAEKPLYHAKCKSCGSSTYGHGRDCAITAWNRRAPPAAVETHPLPTNPVVAHEAGNVKRNPPDAVPEGWVMAPKEPTPEMHEAAARMDIPRLWEHERAALYRTMISAAPAAPTDGGNDEHH